MTREDIKNYAEKVIGETKVTWGKSQFIYHINTLLESLGKPKTVESAEEFYDGFMKKTPRAPSKSICIHLMETFLINQTAHIRYANQSTVGNPEIENYLNLHQIRPDQPIIEDHFIKILSKLGIKFHSYATGWVTDLLSQPSPNEGKEELQQAVKGSEEAIELFNVGDTIVFDFFGQIKQGIIQYIGKHGYWIDSGSITGSGSIRCDFHKAKKVKSSQENQEQTHSVSDRELKDLTDNFCLLNVPTILHGSPVVKLNKTKLHELFESFGKEILSKLSTPGEDKKEIAKYLRIWIQKTSNMGMDKNAKNIERVIAEKLQQYADNRIQNDCSTCMHAEEELNPCLRCAIGKSDKGDKDNWQPIN